MQTISFVTSMRSGIFLSSLSFSPSGTLLLLALFLMPFQCIAGDSVITASLDGAIRERYQINSSGVKNGMYEKWFSGGLVKQEESHYKNGLRVGVSTIWRLDGTIFNRGTFSDDGILVSDLYLSRYRLYTLEWTYLNKKLSGFTLNVPGEQIVCAKYDLQGGMKTGVDLEWAGATSAVGFPLAVWKDGKKTTVDTTWGTFLSDIGQFLALPQETIAKLQRVQALENLLATNVDFIVDGLEVEEAVTMIGRLVPGSSGQVEFHMLDQNKLISINARNVTFYQLLLKLSSECNLSLKMDERPSIRLERIPEVKR